MLARTSIMNSVNTQSATVVTQLTLSTVCKDFFVITKHQTKKGRALRQQNPPFSCRFGRRGGINPSYTRFHGEITDASGYRLGAIDRRAFWQTNIAHQIGFVLCRNKPARYLIKQPRSEEHTSELQSRPHLVCRLLLEKKKKKKKITITITNNNKKI